MLGRPNMYLASTLPRLYALVCWFMILGVVLLAKPGPGKGGLLAVIATTDAAVATEAARQLPLCEAIRSVNSGLLSCQKKSQAAEDAELRHTIEESVLKKLACGMKEHQDKVDRGERRPRPFVTLTYAQSIDGSIATANRSPVRDRGTAQLHRH